MCLTQDVSVSHFREVVLSLKIWRELCPRGKPSNKEIAAHLGHSLGSVRNIIRGSRRKSDQVALAQKLLSLDQDPDALHYLQEFARGAPPEELARIEASAGSKKVPATLKDNQNPAQLTSPTGLQALPAEKLSQIAQDLSYLAQRERDNEAHQKSCRARNADFLEQSGKQLEQLQQATQARRRVSRDPFDHDALRERLLGSLGVVQLAQNIEFTDMLLANPRASRNREARGDA